MYLNNFRHISIKCGHAYLRRSLLIPGEQSCYIDLVTEEGFTNGKATKGNVVQIDWEHTRQIILHFGKVSIE